MAIFPAVALAEGLTIEQPTSPSLNTTPVFEGHSNGSIFEVHVVVVSIGSSETWHPIALTGAERWSASQELPPGNYTVSVSQENTPFPEDTAGPVAFTIDAAPKVKTNPTTQSVATGGNATFSATASGLPTPTVQWWVSTDNGATWQEDSSDAGNNTGTLTVGSVSEGENGWQYHAVFTNEFGQVTSGAASLLVHRATEPPSLPEDVPADATALVGNPVEFVLAGIRGNPEPTIQWYWSPPGKKEWKRVQGAVYPRLLIPETSLSENGNQYAAELSNGVGAKKYSRIATLSVTSAAPHVTIQPISTASVQGGTATFTSSASGGPPPAVQWQVSSNGGATWSSVPGATSDTLVRTNIALSETGDLFRAMFVNPGGSEASSAATLTVTTSPPVPVTQSAISAPGLVPGFSVFPAAPHVGETVTFASTSTDVASPIIGFAWDFAGNGSYLPGGPLNTTSFATPGPHVVHLRASAANGVTREVGQTINVLARQFNLIQPFPIVRMVGSLTSAGVKVSLLTVQAPAGSLVSARCVGKRCPLKLNERVYAIAHAGSTRVPPVTLWRFQRFLRSGVVLQIKVSKAGQVGKYTSFTVRRGKVPVRNDECLDPTRLTPMVCPGS